MSLTSDQVVRWGWGVALYSALLWLCWPSLSFPALSLQDRDLLDALAPLPLMDALGWVGHTPLRPAQNLFFWLIAHSGMLLPWRAALVAGVLLTTALVHYSAAERGGSFVENIGAAACVSINATTFSVVCWLSAAHVGLSGLFILAYFEAARRALDREAHRTRWAAAALLALSFALSFYELAVLAPIAVLFWHGMFSSRRFDRPTSILYLGSAACVAAYLALQVHALAGVQLWAAPADLVLANVWRVGLLNFWVWLNPFDTFGVLIPDGLSGHALENTVCWLLAAIELALMWKLRRFDPISVFGAIWSLLFLVPAGALMQYEGSAIALQRMYIPMLGLVWPGVRFLTHWLEKLHDSIQRRSLRIGIMLPLSALLLWSVVPMLAECYHEVRLWGDEEQLYLATLRNYPESPELLGRVTRNYLAYRDAPIERSSTEPWQSLIDALLMRPARDSAEILIKQGHALVDRARYVEAGSAFARALGAGAQGEMRLDAGTTLVLALLHTDQRVSALPLEERLRREYPGQTESSFGPR